jgi:hypothetical protein
MMGEPELRTTPTGTSVLRITIEGPGDMGTPVVMTGERTLRLRTALKSGAEIRVKGSLKAVRRRLKSGLIETGYEVAADSIEIEEGAPQVN